MRSAPLLDRLEPIASLPAEHRRDLLSFCREEALPRSRQAVALATRPAQEALYLTIGEMRLGFADGSAEVFVGATGKASWPLGQAGPRPVSGLAITDVTLMHVDATALDQLLTWNQTLHGLGARTPVWQSGGQRLPAALLTRGAFAQLPPAHIEALLNRFTPLAVEAGQEVIREGQAGDAYYLIESGRAQVVREVGGAELQVAELGPGQAFGEEALVSGAPRNATVRMRTPGHLLRLAKPDFLELLQAPLLKSLDWPAARRQVEAGACWLDVRYPAEFALDALPGAKNIPLNEIRNAFGVLPRHQRYIVYCHTGRRSSAAAFLLAQQGFDACWLEGGLPETRDCT